MNIGIVVPCYNEEHRIQIKYWQKIISSIDHACWIFVDDGSKDKTFAILKKNLNYKNVQVLSLKRNHGKSEAVRIGMIELLQRKNKIFAVGFLDSDSAFLDSDLIRMLKISEKKFHDRSTSINSLISSRVKLAGRNISRNIKRHYISRILLTVINWNWAEAPYDTQSGFKIFKNTDKLNAALATSFKTRWFVDLEIFARIGAMHGPNQIWEEPAEFWQEVPGSKIGVEATIKIVRDILLIMNIVRKARGEN